MEMFFTQQITPKLKVFLVMLFKDVKYILKEEDYLQSISSDDFTTRFKPTPSKPGILSLTSPSITLYKI